jgi:methyl-accepting chemotaxis protein
MGLTSPVQAAVRSAGAAVDRLDRILCSLETLGGSIASIERDMRGMRKDLQSAVAGIESLRGDVRGLDGSIVGIREATERLEEQVSGLGKSLKRIDSLVPRLSRRARSEHAASAG